jgi:hypothetical protein
MYIHFGQYKTFLKEHIVNSALQYLRTYSFFCST